MYKIHKPPIKEVVFAISLQKLYNDIKELDLISKDIEQKLPNRIAGIDKEVKISKSGIEQQDSLNGYIFLSMDRLNTLFLQKERITYSSKEPYEKFEKIFGKYMEYCDMITNIKYNLNPKVGPTIGLRYNNVFNLSPKEFEKYTRFMPNIKLECNMSMKSFTSSFIISSPVGISRTSIITKPIAINGLSKMNVTFDIDTQKNISSLDRNELTESFNQLRKFKNDIFFNNLDVGNIGDFNE